MDHEEALDTFCSITQASRHVAEHYLAAHEFDLDRSISFYLEHPPAPDTAVQSHPIDDDDLPEAPAPPSGAYGAAPASQPVAHDYHDLDAEDDELQQVLAASLRTATADPAEEPTVIEIPDDDDVVEVPRRPTVATGRRSTQAAKRTTVDSQRRSNESSSSVAFNRSGPRLPHEDEFPFMGVQGQAIPIAGPSGRVFSAADPTPAAAATRPTRANRHRPEPMWDDDYDDDLGAPPPQSPPHLNNHLNIHQGLDNGTPSIDAAAADAVALAASASAVADADMPQLPDDVNVEEARMIEAMLFGRPYDGPLADFSNRSAAVAQPLSPGGMERWDLRREQDDAYEQSLRAARAKAVAAERSRREAEEGERQQRQAADDAARDKRRAEEEAERQRREEEQRLEAMLEERRLRLQPEPQPGEDSVVIMIRLPEGGRKSRRFRKTDSLQSIFDYVDTELQGKPHAPGSYQLVQQFPRRVYEDGSGSGSLADAGLTADQALFLESRQGKA